MAQLLLAWLAMEFQGIHVFTLYLMGEFGCMFDRMNQANVNISRKTVFEFAEGFAQAAHRQVEFRNQSKDKNILFAELTRKHSTDPNCGKILLGGLPENLQAAFEKENRTLPRGKVALLKISEPLEKMSFEGYQTVKNQDIFCDRLYAASM